MALLSSLTMWIEHHDAMLAAGVLPALLRTVEDQTSVPQVGYAASQSWKLCVDSTVSSRAVLTVWRGSEQVSDVRH